MGQDKALIEVDGKSLLEHQVEKAEPFFDEVVLLGGQNSYPMENRNLQDEMENAGPLAGLFAALKDGDDSSISHIAIIPVDLPYISESTIERLSDESLRPSENAIILANGENLQPLAGVYRTRLAGQLDHYLKSGNRMVFGFVNQLAYSKSQVDEAELKNFNTPEDLIL